MEVDRLADPEFHEEGRLRGFVLGEESTEVTTGGFTMVGGAGKVCTDEMCEF